MLWQLWYVVAVVAVMAVMAFMAVMVCCGSCGSCGSYGMLWQLWHLWQLRQLWYVVAVMAVMAFLAVMVCSGSCGSCGSYGTLWYVVAWYAKRVWFCALSSARLCFIACKNVKSRRSSCLEKQPASAGAQRLMVKRETKQARWTSSLQLPALRFSRFLSWHKMTQIESNS